jgi:DNA-binding PadR family transcriptional regulator
VQDLPDVVRTLVLLSLGKGRALDRPSLKRRVDRLWTGPARVEVGDLDKSLGEMASEGLLTVLDDGKVQLTQRGYTLSREWRNLLLKREPILEIVAGLTDGSITALIVILSTILAGLTFNRAIFAAFLTLASVSITNFSSFVLGGITEDLADILSLQNLINYSLSDIPDRRERDKSLALTKELFSVLRGEITRTNIRAAVLSGTTTFLAGGIPIVAYLLLPRPWNQAVSLGVVAIGGILLVRYRSMRTRTHWKITLIQTLVIIIIAVAASLLLGGRM